MSVRRLLLGCLVLLLAPASAAAAESPIGGPEGQFAVDAWRFKLDPRDRGMKAEWFRGNAAGWRIVRSPHAWNANDESDDSMRGSIAWYRAVVLSENGATMRARFGSVNVRATVWLNGRRVGSHSGTYLPFEFDLPMRKGSNRLFVRVENIRRKTDFPPQRPAPDGMPRGGWWNYGGLLREVTVRPVAAADLLYVGVRTEHTCAGCAAVVRASAVVRNTTRDELETTVRATIGGSDASQRIRLVPGESRTVELSVDVPNARLWSPDDPELYPLTVVASGGGDRSTYRHAVGIRTVSVQGGRLMLNGRPLNFRGFGVHEDEPRRGGAWSAAAQEQMIADVRRAGGTFVRSHYPLHPRVLRLADRQGILVWSEIPVYSLRYQDMARSSVRRRALRTLRKMILAQRSHPSIITWSIGNELHPSPDVRTAVSRYIAQAADVARALDPSRPVSLAILGYPLVGCQAAYEPLDFIGVNEYFGWYPGPRDSVASVDSLKPYLEQVRACYPRHAIAVTEFGAEADREGPVEEKGTFAFQTSFVQTHLGIHGQLPWLSGSSYWTLREFRVRPDWGGGNPKPIGDGMHRKGLITYDGVDKPAFGALQELYRSTQQIGPPPR